MKSATNPHQTQNQHAAYLEATVKTLHLRRHSKKDAQDNISPEGLNWAEREGTRMADQKYDFAFHGPLVPTRQTLDAFFRGHGGNPAIGDPINDLGDAEMFNTLVNDAFRTAIKKGYTNLGATFEAHAENIVAAWKLKAYEAVRKMFSRMREGSMGIGFFHSPTLELAVDFCGGPHPFDWSRLAELEGFVFTYDELDVVVTGRIDVPVYDHN